MRETFLLGIFLKVTTSCFPNTKSGSVRSARVGSSGTGRSTSWWKTESGKTTESSANTSVQATASGKSAGRPHYFFSLTTLPLDGAVGPELDTRQEMPAESADFSPVLSFDFPVK